MKRLAAIALCACPLVACGDERAVEPRPEPVTEQRRSTDGYQPIELEDGGAIFGVVRWVGPLPELEPLPVRTDREVCGSTQPSPALSVSERRGVRDVVLWLVDPSSGRPLVPPEEPPVVALSGCRFAPHVRAVGVGWPVRFTSSDPIIHNVHAVSGGETLLDVGLPEAGASRAHAFESPGVVRLVCDAGHGWELGWVHVFDHPYFAVTGENGRFRLSDVPPGQYVMQVWHEGWQVDGTRAGRPRYSNPIVLTRTVSVSPRQETSMDFQLSERSATVAGHE